MNYLVVRLPSSMISVTLIILFIIALGLQLRMRALLVVIQFLIRTLSENGKITSKWNSSHDSLNVERNQYPVYWRKNCSKKRIIVFAISEQKMNENHERGKIEKICCSECSVLNCLLLKWIEWEESQFH